ncbi:DNA-cytosine methyltransferase [Methanococcus vannielii SB]|jgi:DNA (cytosine-5)-methyltransferase 1|uniref:DNA (cytosine-5-)-methyltransferase n=1 Tax=Methanococcus vannielii (strain ATCC 35089 / DSM 1224 / JCM 13029 / OCM 148 / SB) TaxID=406327 RepID=A6USQ3_METVS|nr:DNA cytosine methyltransferase [Methanococcus vannielii]ABR55525.1 DNA-cytosine methyltransferase [Methanococcus vannielii SB]
MKKSHEIHKNQGKLISTENIKLVDTMKPINYAKKFKVISLFSGCGGMDLGFKGGFEIFKQHYEHNPYEIIFSNDISDKACRTYESNFCHSSVCADIKDIKNEDIPNADIVIGGFPCQDFSHAGKRKGLSAERGRLYLEMKRVIDYIKPIAFVAENVDGIRTNSKGKDTTALDIILKDFMDSGYQVAYKVLNTADYGVPQTRIRVIIMGIRNDYVGDIMYPKPVRGNEGLFEWMTSKEAIDDLWDKIDSKEVFNHSSKDYSKAKFYPGKKMQGNYKILADRPSITIRAEHHGNIEAHYRSYNNEDPEDMGYWRRLSVRECARLQSFPDDFNFPFSASEAYKQIGNAVPPILGWHIARALYHTLTKNKKS